MAQLKKVGGELKTKMTASTTVLKEKRSLWEMILLLLLRQSKTVYLFLMHFFTVSVMLKRNHSIYCSSFISFLVVYS